ncbi:hypothetical protein COOONC_08772, partial [Cooperia oncophora]
MTAVRVTVHALKVIHESRAKVAVVLYIIMGYAILILHDIRNTTISNYLYHLDVFVCFRSVIDGIRLYAHRETMGKATFRNMYAYDDVFPLGLSFVLMVTNVACLFILVLYVEYAPVKTLMSCLCRCIKKNQLVSQMLFLTSTSLIIPPVRVVYSLKNGQ